MKKLIQLFLALFGTFIISASCSKEEQSQAKNPDSKLKKYALTVPLSDGRTMIEMKDGEGPSMGTRQSDEFHNTYRKITVLDMDYINSTKLIDISKLPLNTVYDSIGDKNLQVKFVGGLLKMAGYPNGWTAHWNVLPYTECEDPPVLYSQQQNHITIILSKYCESFGFELSPNLTSTFEFSAGFYTSQENSPVASVTQMATTPSGARLFAVESKRPFNVIEIQYTGNALDMNHPYGFAIANIRYRLFK